MRRAGETAIPDMPDSGQLSLLEFISAGGGMVTCEWVTFDSVTGRFTKLRAALPATYGGYAGWFRDPEGNTLMVVGDS